MLQRTQFSELNAFLVAAETKNFARAAGVIGVSAPTFSQSIRSLEEKLGVRLLNRTTRGVSLTEPGEQLLARLQPLMSDIGEAIESVNSFREKPIGTLRLGVMRCGVQHFLLPLLPGFLARYPEIDVEVSIEDVHGDLVAKRHDAGIQVGERIEKDMIATRIKKPYDMLAVASPAYLEANPEPLHPTDLRDHNCIRERALWDGAIHPWKFEKDGETIDVAVSGLLTVNDKEMAVRSAVLGMGIAYAPAPLVAQHSQGGALVPVLEDWALTMSGVYIYYASRRQPPATLRAFIDYMHDVM